MDPGQHVRPGPRFLPTPRPPARPTPRARIFAAREINPLTPEIKSLAAIAFAPPSTSARAPFSRLSSRLSGHERAKSVTAKPRARRRERAGTATGPADAQRPSGSPGGAVRAPGGAAPGGSGGVARVGAGRRGTGRVGSGAAGAGRRRAGRGGRGGRGGRVPRAGDGPRPERGDRLGIPGWRESLLPREWGDEAGACPAAGGNRRSPGNGGEATLHSLPRPHSLLHLPHLVRTTRQ